MRDNIIKKRVRADEVVNKAPVPNRELQHLQQSNGMEQAQDDSADWHTNDLSGDYQNDSYTCPSCFKKFDRKAVYTSHVQACSDAKCREKDKSKKRKAKEETKMKQLLEFEDNSNASEQSTEVSIPVATTSAVVTPGEVDTSVNKRKRKRTNKVRKDEAETKAKLVASKEESNSVDWNLDDEEEKKKLENIKKEIIEDDYKRVQEIANTSINTTADFSSASTSKAQIDSEPSPDDDDEDSALVIDEKPEEEVGSQLKCPQCDKVFDTDDKIKYHLNTYHSRQKRFKCKMCEYQGYRKKDTMNHLDYVHKISGDRETLEKYMESVMKAVDEKSLAKQNELKKTQLKIKRKIARERMKMNGVKDDANETVTSAALDEREVKKEKANNESKQLEFKSEVKMEFKEPTAVTSEPPSPVKPPKIRRKSLHTSILIPPESDSSDDVMKIPKMFIKAKVDAPEEKKKRKKRDSGGRTSSPLLPALQPSTSYISKFGKIIKRTSNGDSKEGGTQRPIRNRIKPVRKDFLYDLSDLLKKDADAYREQVVQSNPAGCKRELRKRAMSTNTREIPDFEGFSPNSSQHSLLGPPAAPSKDEDDIPLVKFKDTKHRRMSVFAPPARPMYGVPRSPVYKPHQEPTASKPNAGAAYRMAVNEFNANRASMFEEKFLWTICFDREPKRTSPVTSTVVNTPTTSAAASILQKLSGKRVEPVPAENISKSKSAEEKSLLAEQLCQSFDMINVSNSENEFDISDTRAVNLNPTGNGLVALALEEAGNDVCVLQECNSDDDDDEDVEPSSSSANVSDVESKKIPVSKRRGRKSKKNSEKRNSGANGQRRLTVMQRLQENKFRKSREQLFKRLIMERQNEDENPSSPVYNLFSES